MFPVLRPILNKGGAGHYVDRATTAERLNPFVAQHQRLLSAYDYALGRLRDGEAKARLEALMPHARTHAAKLSETVFSTGGTPPNGTAFDPGAFGKGSSDAEMLYHVLELERDYHDALTEEVDAVHHQERTRAILGHVARGSEERLEALRGLTNRLPRPARD
jgi:bacterioferritin (cytochrome b1)